MTGREAEQREGNYCSEVERDRRVCLDGDDAERRGERSHAERRNEGMGGLRRPADELSRSERRHWIDQVSGVSRICCNRAASSGGSLVNQERSIRPTPIMS